MDSVLLDRSSVSDKLKLKTFPVSGIQGRIMLQIIKLEKLNYP